LTPRTENNFSVKVTFKAVYESRLIFSLYIIWFILVTEHWLEDGIPVRLAKLYLSGIMLWLASRLAHAPSRITVMEVTLIFQGSTNIIIFSFHIQKLNLVARKHRNPGISIELWGRLHISLTCVKNIIIITTPLVVLTFIICEIFLWISLNNDLQNFPIYFFIDT
jgi:hypothetical protein